MTVSIDIPNYERIDAMVWQATELKKSLYDEARKLPTEVYIDLEDTLEVLDELIGDLRATSEQVQEDYNEFESSDRIEHSTYFNNIQGIS